MANGRGKYHYNFGFDGSLNEVGEENIKEVISDYFDGRDDADIVEFVGNQTPPPADIMRVIVEAENGYGIIEDLKFKTLDYGHNISLIQGGAETP